MKSEEQELKKEKTYYPKFENITPLCLSYSDESGDDDSVTPKDTSYNLQKKTQILLICNKVIEGN